MAITASAMEQGREDDHSATTTTAEPTDYYLEAFRLLNANASNDTNAKVTSETSDFVVVTYAPTPSPTTSLPEPSVEAKRPHVIFRVLGEIFWITFQVGIFCLFVVAFVLGGMYATHGSCACHACCACRLARRCCCGVHASIQPLHVVMYGAQEEPAVDSSLLRKIILHCILPLVDVITDFSFASSVYCAGVCVHRWACG